MDRTPQFEPAAKYSLHWLGTRCLFLLGIAFVLSMIACGIDSFASSRVDAGLISGPRYTLVANSIVYCFGVLAITSVSLLLVEIAFRKDINYLQYALIAMALTLFYLLLLAMSEKMPFPIAYATVSVMTIALIAAFIKGITQDPKAVRLTVGILFLEYGMIYVLVNIGAMALLIGSITLFLLIAVAMYFTLKLKIENDELVIK
ncbi:MAG: cell envelope integrity protein CreD [Muribaculaceae bacterium]|nr:cell envelope integrity protein CreD [Muribaculaceae bacterium]